MRISLENPVGTAIDTLVEDAGDPEEVGTFLKCLAHQGILAPLSHALGGHSLVTAGVTLHRDILRGDSLTGTPTKYSLARVESDTPDEHIYRLTGSFDTREAHYTGVIPIAPGVYCDRSQSYIQGEISLLVTVNSTTQEASIGLDRPPRFEYQLTLAPPPPGED